MKLNRRFAAPFVAAFSLATPCAFAQPAMPEAPISAGAIARVAPALAPLDEANWRAIRVQYSRPSLLAYWLDPTNNELPAFVNMPGFLQTKRAVSAPRRAPEEKRVRGPFDLPDGVHLAPADEQKLLFVAAKDDVNFAQIRELVDILDQPMRSVEIEAQIVELPATELKQFGIDFSTARGNFDAATAKIATEAVPGAFQIGFVRNDFQERLDKLIEAGTAKALSTQPLILINNMSQSVSLRSGPIDNTGANQYKLPTTPKEGNDTILTLTPTINGDDTITVLMNIERLPKEAMRRGLETVVNVRDGDTIALGGLSSPLIPRPIPRIEDIPLITSRQAGDIKEVLIFVTARIVRGEEK